MLLWLKKISAFGLGLLLLPLLFGQPKRPLAPIALYNQFDQQPPPAVVAALREELDKIMTPMGINFDWRDLDAPHDELPTVELAVLTFKGRCDAAGLRPTIATPGPLGWTHISDGVILPFSDIDCSRIRTFLQGSLLSLPPRNRDEVYGRALGRVVAHELYHIFAGTTHHGAFGVGKEAYTVRDLMSAKFRFEERESKALMGSKSYETLEKPFDSR